MKRGLLYGLFMAVAIATPSYALELELVELEEEERDAILGNNPRITFNGRVQNTGNLIIENPRAVLTIKRDGRVIDVIKLGFIEGPSEGQLLPGDIGTFSLDSRFERGEFDEVVVTFTGREIVGSAFSGDLRIIESSLSLTETWPGDATLLGEYVNETNAIITDVEIRFVLLDADGGFLGAAEHSDMWSWLELWPGQVAPFEANSDVAFDKVHRWEATWSFRAVRLAPALIPTAVPAVSWGRLKAERILADDLFEFEYLSP